LTALLSLRLTGGHRRKFQGSATSLFRIKRAVSCRQQKGLAKTLETDFALAYNKSGGGLPPSKQSCKDR
jgi:hypothetical protein